MSAAMPAASRTRDSAPSAPTTRRAASRPRPVRTPTPAPVVSRIRSLARERATTRVLSGAAAGSGAGGAGSSSATRNAAPPAPRASNAAAHAPTGPPPTTTTSNMLERQTAGEPWRRAADAGADARQRALRRRKQIEHEESEVAQHARAGPCVGKQPHQAVGEVHQRTAIARAPLLEAAQQ